MLASLDFEGGCQLPPIFIAHDQCRVDVTLDPVSERVELLFGGDELAELELVLILRGQEDLVQPRRDVFDGLV